MLQFWLLFIGSEYKIDHQYACSTIWSAAVTVFGEDPGNCTLWMEDVDYNNDGYFNFREYISVAYQFFEGEPLKASQLNCSSCVGMENYNI